MKNIDKKEKKVKIEIKKRNLFIVDKIDEMKMHLHI